MRNQIHLPAFSFPASLAVFCVLVFLIFQPVRLEAQERAGPLFNHGQAQVVPAFEDSSGWIREELWVETEFDSDGDGKLDRVHVAVVRQGQTESEGLKVPVIYESSPYFSGTAGGAGLTYFWNPRHEMVGHPRENITRSGGSCS